MKNIMMTIALLLMSAAAYAYSCQYDNMSLHFTGETKIEYGKLVKRYECAAGHSYWIVD